MRPNTRVLIADDDPQLLDALAETLEQSGAKAVRAHNGAELIDRLADSGPFDLIVTDIAMPWMTGLSSMRAARTAGLGAAVIVITGLRDETIPAQVRALGRNAVLLRKPFEMRELESAVELVLADHETRCQ
jgi:two-component system cell cycle response regulator CpdR